MANATQCPSCGIDLGSDASEGSCPQCGSEIAAPRVQTTVGESLPERIFADQLTEPIEDSGSAMRALLGLPPSLSNYMIIGPPKRGGMGTVWPAKQLGTKRTVAIKILATQHLTPGGQGRFVREVELSAQLQHPNIARIYDSGVHQGDYYYAMEMIDGLPLDQYVAKHKSDQLKILELLRLICNAVQHAHVRGVIHCDIKPANILVSEDGQPHVLDFGLARLTTARPDGLTDNGSAPGTPSWMSPEQAAGELERIDTRTDVYSLGKLLYQLLTGQPPHRLDGPITQVLHRIATQEVRPPKEVCPALSSELCAMLLKALAHDPEQRYLSAGELGRDIAHYQSGEPISAIPSSMPYQLRKWVARHRLGVAIATVILASFIGAGTYWQAQVRRERINRDLMSEFSVSLLKAINPGNKNGPDMIPVLMQQAKVLSSRFEDDPLMQAELAEKLGSTFLTYGLLEGAEEQFRNASNLREKKQGSANAQTIAAKERLAQICRERGKLQEAEQICRQVLGEKHRRWGESHRQTLRAAIALGQVLEQKALLGDEPGAMAQAEAILRDTQRLCQTSLDATDLITLEAKAALVPVLRFQGGAKLAEADRLSQETLQARQRILGARDRQTIESVHARADVLATLGRPKDAVAMYREALIVALTEAGWSSPFAPATQDHPDLIIWFNDLAYALTLQGEFAEAQLIYSDILPASIRSRGAAHPINIIIRKNLAATFAGQGKWAEAQKEFEEATKLHASIWGEEGLGTLNLLDYQAWALTKQKHWDKAAEIYERTLAARLKKLPADDPVIVASKEQLRFAKSKLSTSTRPSTQPDHNQ